MQSLCVDIRANMKTAWCSCWLIFKLKVCCEFIYFIYYVFYGRRRKERACWLLTDSLIMNKRCGLDGMRKCSWHLSHYSLERFHIALMEVLVSFKLKWNGILRPSESVWKLQNECHVLWLGEISTSNKFY